MVIMQSVALEDMAERRLAQKYQLRQTLFLHGSIPSFQMSV